MDFFLKLALALLYRLGIDLLLMVGQLLLETTAATVYRIAVYSGRRISRTNGIIYELYQQVEDIRPVFESFHARQKLKYIRLASKSNLLRKQSLKLDYRLSMIRYLCFVLWDFVGAGYKLTFNYVYDRFRLHNSLRRLLFSTGKGVAFIERLCNFRAETGYKFSFQILVNQSGKIFSIDPIGIIYLQRDDFCIGSHIDELLELDYHSHSSIVSSRFSNSSLFAVETGKFNANGSTPSILLVACPVSVDNNSYCWSYLVIPINHHIHLAYRGYSIFWRFWCRIKFSLSSRQT